MRGAINDVIPVVMAVIIAGALLLMGFQVISKTRGGIESIWGTGESYRQRIANMESLADSCNQWITGDRYYAKSILDVYRLPDKMRPYKYVWNYCGQWIEELARDCYSETSRTSKCAGNGYILADRDEVKVCETICNNIIKVYDKCKASCPDNAVNCFDRMLSDYIGSEIKSRDLTVTSSLLEKACTR